MRTSQFRRVLARIALSGILLSLMPTVSATSALGSVSRAVAAADQCTVTAADVVWGFKESFRSYISGTIAEGQWEVTGGAAYETPNFSWTGGSGSYDPATQTGSVAFTGAIHFTGHGGLLDTTVANPTLEFTGPGTAQVLLDISGISMEDALTGSAEIEAVTQVPLVDVVLSAAEIDSSGDAITITAADTPTSITADGFTAFGNYETGTPFDPLSLTVTATCPPDERSTPSATPAVADDAEETVTTDAVPAADTGNAWVPWVVAGFLAIAAAVGGLLLARRRTRGGTTHGGQP